MVKVSCKGSIELVRSHLSIDIALKQDCGFFGRFKSFHADACEGVFDFIMKLVAKEIVGPLNVEKAQAAKAMHDLVARYDYSSFGGAPLLGIDGICIICHGSSGDRAIRNAIGMAAQYARNRLNEKIVEELDALPTGNDDE